MRHLLAFLYGIAAYLLFFATFNYAIAFIAGVGVAKTIDSGEQGSPLAAIVIDIALISLFAVQHSVMARRGFKAWWTRFVPPAIERSTYVLAATLALAFLMWQWRPLPAVVWQVSDPTLAGVLYGLAGLGWFVALSSTFLLNHLELVGLHQVFAGLKRQPMPEAAFRTPLYYRLVRHPIYVGFIVAFWVTPHMTAGHLLFAAATTAYIFVGIALEERDLITVFGDEYRRYRERVGMVLPKLRRSQPSQVSPSPSGR